mmetsp:Transcript_64685/g.173377  ORF Transcript_64685/g.173377 Transcript_64685/m.173377 type:complete len:207 (+) Transcript_64685:440-1060(+)
MRTCCPSMTRPCASLRTREASATDAKSTKQKPRDWPVPCSWISRTRPTVAKCEKVARMVASVVSAATPRTMSTLQGSSVPLASHDRDPPLPDGSTALTSTASSDRSTLQLKQWVRRAKLTVLHRSQSQSIAWGRELCWATAATGFDASREYSTLPSWLSMTRRPRSPFIAFCAASTDGKSTNAIPRLARQQNWQSPTTIVFFFAEG